MKRTLLARVAIILLIASPIIELVNSIYLRQTTETFFTPGQLYKFLLIFILFLLLTHKQRLFYVLVLTAGGIFSLLHLAMAAQPTLSFLLSDLLFIFKLTYFLPVLLFLWQRTFPLATFATTAWFLITTNIILGYLGYGYAQYALGYGSKGFFYSGNEMATTFLVTSALLLYCLYKKQRIIMGIALSFLLIFIAVLQGMKTLLVGIPLVALATPILLSFDTIKRSFHVYFSPKKLLLYLAGGILLIGTLGVLLASFSPTFFTRFNEIAARSGIIGAILSERDDKAVISLDYYSNYLSLPQKIVGSGITIHSATSETPLGISRSTELDPLDLFIWFGIVAILYYATWAYFIWRSSKIGTPEGRFVTFINILLFIISAFSGHVIYSAFLIPYWMAVNALLSLNSNVPSSPIVVFLGATIGGGINTYMEETAQSLKAKGLTVHIINTHKIPDFIAAIIRLTSMTFASQVSGKRLILHYHMATKGSFLRKFLLALLFYVSGAQQILHLHGAENTAFFSTILALPGGKTVAKLFLSLFDEIISVSPTMLNEMQQLLRRNNIALPTSNWHTLPNAIHIPEPLPTPAHYEKGDPLKLLFIGRLVPQKDLHTALKSVALAKARGVSLHFTLAGNGSSQKELEELTTDLGITDVVTFLGWVDNKKLLTTILPQQHVFLISSVFESFGIVVLEAYLNGLPAIASRTGGLQDVVIDGKTGILCPPKDVEAFADAIELLAKNQTLLRKYQHAAQEEVLRYSYTHHSKSLLNIYRVIPT